MILRKPYAFLIKYFRLIHILLAFLAFYAILRTRDVLDFFNVYISDMVNLTGQEIPLVIPEFYGYACALIIVIDLIIIWLMIAKKKPTLFYIINTILYVYVLITIFIYNSTLESLNYMVPDIRLIRLVRDLSVLSFILQFVCIPVVAVRAIGFDVKKFNFKEDLKELEISDADREEFEVEFNFDKNEFLRKINKRKRYIIYSYKENKALYYIFFTVFLLISGYLVYSDYIDKVPIVNENTTFSGNGFTLKVTNSYLFSKDYEGNVIPGDNYYLAVKLKIKSNSNDVLDIATTKLTIGPYYFIPTTTDKTKFKDIGKIYQGEKIKNEFETIVLLYKIPKQLIDDDIYFSYINKNLISNKDGAKGTNVRIKYQKMDDIKTSQTYLMGEDISFKESVLNEYTIFITSFDIKEKFKVSYNHCYNSNCYISYLYLKPKLNTNYDKALLKLTGSIIYQDPIDGVYDVYDFIEHFGKIYYTVAGEKKVLNINSNEITNSKLNMKNDCYIEVPYDMIKATSLSIVFTVRDHTYEYMLK